MRELKILGMSWAIDKDKVEFECYLIGLQVHCLNQPLMDWLSASHSTTGLTLKALFIFQTEGSRRLREESFAFDGGLALTFFLLISSFFFTKRIAFLG
jgi:hypothetical protein